MHFSTLPRFINLTSALSFCLQDDYVDKITLVHRLYGRRGSIAYLSHPPVGSSTLPFVNFSAPPLTHLLMSGSLCTEVLGRVQAGWQAGKRVERLSVFANSTCLLLCYVLTSPPEIATLCPNSEDTSHACVFSSTVHSEF